MSVGQMLRGGVEKTPDRNLLCWFGGAIRKHFGAAGRDATRAEEPSTDYTAHDHFVAVAKREGRVGWVIPLDGDRPRHLGAVDVPIEHIHTGRQGALMWFARDGSSQHHYIHDTSLS